jgi:hypothetical protein
MNMFLLQLLRLPLDVSILHQPVLSLEVFVLQQHVLSLIVFVLKKAELILSCLPYSSYTAAFDVPLSQLFLVNAAVGPTPPETLHTTV